MTQPHRWNQGDVIDQELLSLLFEPGEISEDIEFAVIISHDCDLHRESFFELITCSTLDSLNKQYVSAKHPRALHLAFENGSGELFLELKHDSKCRLNFEPIEKEAPAEKKYILSESNKRILKQWLAARYGRPAFPDNFERALRTKYNSKLTLEKKLASILSEYSEYISAVFFELSDECKCESPPEGIYILKIFIAINSSQEISDAQKGATSAAHEIESAFVKVFGEPGESKGVELELCQAIPETEISLTMIRRMDQWRVEYISLDKSEDSVITSGTAAS